MIERILAVALLTLFAAACAGPGTRSSEGYAQTPAVASSAPAGSQLAMAPGRAAVPAGFRALPVAGVRQPSGLAVDDVGGVLVIEAGNRLIRLGPDGGRDLIAEGPAGAHWTGVAAGPSVYFVASSGDTDGGRLLRIELGGRSSVLLDNLPDAGQGLAVPAVGPDGMLYVAVGSVTDAGIVDKGEPWRPQKPMAHDVPCQDVRLTGRNFTQDHSHTGAFVPYGQATKAGEIVRGQIPCSGGVLRIMTTGGTPQLVAWGFRNPRSLAFTPDGRLYLLDDNFHGNGVRPVGQGGDLVFAVAPGVWYGWPDVHGSQPAAAPLLDARPNPPPRPVAEFPAGSRALALDVARADLFGGPAQAYLAVLVPNYGFRIVRLDLRNGSLTDFAEFPDASAPLALHFSRTGDALYVLETGGTLWRVERDIPIG